MHLQPHMYNTDSQPTNFFINRSSPDNQTKLTQRSAERNTNQVPFVDTKKGLKGNTAMYNSCQE